MFDDALIICGYIILVASKYKTCIRMPASDIGQPQLVQGKGGARLHFWTSPNSSYFLILWFHGFSGFDTAISYVCPVCPLHFWQNKCFMYFLLPCCSSLGSQADQAIQLLGVLLSIIQFKADIKACKGHNGFGGSQTFLMFQHTALSLLCCLKHLQSFRWSAWWWFFTSLIIQKYQEIERN